MTTMDTTRGSALIWLGTYLAKRGEKAMRAREYAHTWAQTIVRLTLHIAGFSCLTIGAFSLSFLWGMVAAGISCFAFSWLLTSKPNSEINTRR